MNIKLTVGFFCLVFMVPSHALAGAGTVDTTAPDSTVAEEPAVQALAEEPVEKAVEVKAGGQEAAPAAEQVVVAVTQETCQARCAKQCGSKEPFMKKACANRCAKACKPNGTGLFKCSTYYYSSMREVVEEMYGKPFPLNTGFVLDAGKEVRPVVAKKIAEVKGLISAMKRDKAARAVEAAKLRARGSRIKSDSEVVAIYEEYLFRLRNSEGILKTAETAGTVKRMILTGDKCLSTGKPVFFEMDGEQMEQMLTAYESCGFSGEAYQQFFKRIRYKKDDCLNNLNLHHPEDF